MTRSIRGSRRAALLLAGTAAATGLLLSGCGAGQVAETAKMAPTISGVNAQTADNAFKVRNVAVAYRDPKGYPAGDDAPLEVAIYNDSPKAVTVTVTTDSARWVVLSGGAGSTPAATPASASPTGTASASPTGTASASPTAPTPVPTPPAPPRIQIPAGGFVTLNRATGSFLQLVGLTTAVGPADFVNLVFNFDGTELKTTVPVATPLTPAPPATPIIHNEEEGKEHGG